MADQETSRPHSRNLFGGDSAHDHEVTAVLERWTEGEPSASDRLLALVYNELRRIARRSFGTADRATVQPTVLVHEAFLRLSERGDLRFEDRSHFYGIAARVMRQILAESIRHRGRLKRGGGQIQVNLEAVAELRTSHRDFDTTVLHLTEALNRLEEIDPLKARLVELRYFAGLTVAETAQALELSPSSVVRSWRTARAWLFDALSETDAPK